MEKKFKEGEIVYERIRPHQQLIVSTSTGNVYSCLARERPERKPLIFFGRELKEETSSHSKENAYWPDYL